MKLREYIYTFPRGKRMQARIIMAEALGVSAPLIKHWELGIRIPKEEYKKAIEELTDGQVKVEDLTI